MATTQDLPLRNWPSGIRSFVKQTPNGLAGFNIHIARCTSADPNIWPDPASRIRVKVECSYDGGATFPPDGGSIEVDTPGGIALDRDGNEIPFTGIACRFKPVEPSAVRVTVEINGGPIRTSASITVL